MKSPGKTDSSLPLRRWHLLALAVLLALAYWAVERRYIGERRELVLQQDDIAQALTRAYISDKGPIFVADQALYAGRYRINWSDTLVDAVKADSGCGVTVYQGDERIATTLTKPGSGERAFDTKAPPEIAQLVLREGHAFRGRLPLFGLERLIVYTPLKSDEGKVVGMIATYRDAEALGYEITYFRGLLGGTMVLLYLAIVGLFFRIERQVRDVARERRGAIEDRAKQHAKFFESMTQELRTPLSTLLVFASSLVDSVSDDRSREVARRVQGETKDLLTVVDDILDFARIEAGNLALTTEEVDVTKVVQQCAEGLKARAGARAVRVDVQMPEDLPKVNGDPARVQQALTNLLATAILATDDGRVKVRAGSEREAVTVDVTDSGVGLSDQQLATIWDPFHVGQAIGRPQGGSGLALAIARGLVERMGGSVEALAVKGKGTTFRLRLPRATVTV